MRSLKIQISKIDADAMVDSLEVAIGTLDLELEQEIEFGTGTYSADRLRTAIENLQILRADIMLASRNAAKEAAPRRANDADAAAYIARLAKHDHNNPPQ